MKKNTTLKATLFAIFCFSVSFAQTTDVNALRGQHNEVPDHEYVQVDKSTMERSPAYSVSTPNYFTEQANIDENGNNIIGDAGNEPSIAVDPTNPDRIVIGWRQFDVISSNFRQAGNAYSLNGGYEWTNPGVLNPGVFRSDPVLDFDAEGNLYYNSLQGTFACDVYTISDGGQDWGAPVPAFGGDKQWMRIDRSGGEGDKHNYSYWNSSFTTCTGNFTRSTDESQSFEDCVTVDGDPIWGTLAVDSDGTLYTVGQGGSGFIVTKSTTAKDSSIPVSFDSVNNVNLDGQLDVAVPMNPQGLMGQAWIDVDVSGGVNNGNVYVLASVARFSNSDPADVMFAKSTDGGLTFSAPIRVNTDVSETNYQWFGTMSVAPNGRIDVVWLDTRDATNTIDSVLYYTFSEDQGDTWSDELAISEQFDPSIGYPQQNKMGDYYDMVSDNDFAHLAWANTINGGQDVYYSRISPFGILSSNDVVLNTNNVSSYPNPFQESTTIDFEVLSTSETIVEVFDVLGNKVATLLNESVSGLQKITWNGTSGKGNSVSKGIYFVSIQAGSERSIVKVIRE
ncbi:MAG: T9SS type A sorting domain-containing protein [Flavobacteriaceae bacterium]|nr:T9SS type A sorting domain-containing protein [Flavobacteriaceae bacterium]